jgi:hypothetical protein
VEAAAVVLDWGCTALVLAELEAVGKLDEELLQAATDSDTAHTKINLCFTVPRPSPRRQTACYLSYERDKIVLTLSLSN